MPRVREQSSRAGSKRSPPTASGASRFGARSVTHDYSGVVVLHDVDFELRTGAVEGLVGENGSGKSTLVKILTGALVASAGHLVLDDQAVSFASPGAAQQHGIGVVHQDYNLFPDLTVAENVFRVNARPPRRRWSRLVDTGAVDRRVRAIFESLEIDVPPSVLVRSLGPAERKFVEIARAMLLEPRFLILDEPTASLEPRAAASVLALIQRLRSQGVALCFVSHRLDEVLRIADRTTVLRDGRAVGRLTRDEATEDRLARLIIGEARTMAARVEGTVAKADGGRRRGPADAVVLRVSDLQLVEGAPPLRFELRRGEILGMTGLLGSGAADIVRMLGGAMPLTGSIEMDGRRVHIRTPRDASQVGIGFIPEDRKALGIVPDQSVAINISLASLPTVARAGVLSGWRVARRAEQYKAELDIKMRSIHAPVKTLSGGNTQKVMLAKWLASGVRVLAVEEPTHGIDIGAKDQVHALLRRFAAEGGAIVLASTDVNEILALCDRVAIFRHGALEELLSTEALAEVGELATAADAQRFLERLISGGKPEPRREGRAGIQEPGG